MAPMSDSELLSVVKNLAQDFHHLPRKQCQQQAFDLLERCVQRGPDLPPDGCKALLTFILSVAPWRCTGQQRPLQWTCLELLSIAGRSARVLEDAASTVELHNFFFKLAKKEVKSQPTWKPQVAVVMLQDVLRWITAANLAKADSSFKFDVVTSFLEALYGEMARACTNWTPRWRLKSTRALRRVLVACPQALEHAVAFAKKTEEPAAILVSAMTAEIIATEPPSAHRQTLFELYTKQVLEVKGAAPDGKLEAWAPVVGSITAEELGKTIMPLVSRMSKRNPAAIARSYPSMVEYLKLDLSEHIKDVLEPLAVEFLKDKEKKAQGLRVIQKAVSKCSDTTAVVAVAELWAEALKKAGKVDEKQALLTAIATSLQALPAKSSTGGATEGLKRLADPKGGIAKLAGEDANEDTRSLGYASIGAAALALPAAERDSLAQDLLKPLSDKKAPDRARLAVLECLAKLCDGIEGAPSWVGPMLEKSVPLLTLAATKPVHRLQSLLSWACCSSVASTQDDKLASKLKKEELKVLKDGSSFLNSVAIILKAPAAELAPQAQMLQAALRGELTGLPTSSEASKALEEQGGPLKLPPMAFQEVSIVHRTAVVLLAALHEAAGAAADKGDASASASSRSGARPVPIRQIGLEASVCSMSEADADSLILLLTQALLSWLADISSAVRGGAALQVKRSALRGVLEDLCAALSATKRASRPETLALLAVAAHHPLLASGRFTHPGSLWRHLGAPKGKLGEAMKVGAATLWRPLRQMAVTAMKLPASDSTGFRLACLAVTGAFRPSSAESLGPLQEEVRQFVDECKVALHSEEVNKEKDWDVCVFFALEGRLYVEEGTYVAEEREDKNVKKNKFLKDLYDDDDLVADKRPAAGGNKFVPPDRKGKDKPGAKAKAKAGAAASGGNMTQSDIEAAKILEQSETRARIRKYVDEAIFALDALVALAPIQDLQPVLESSAPDLIAHLIILLKSPLTVLRAQRCLRTLVGQIIPEDVLPFRGLLPEALTVVGKGWLQRTPSACGTPGDTPVVEAVLESASIKKVMPPAPFALLLPMILRVLLDSCLPLERVCARALLLLEKQLALGAEVPEGRIHEVFDCLSVVLLMLPPQRHTTQATMSAAAKHLVATEDQLARLAEMFFAEEDVVRSAVIAALAQVVHNESVQDGSLDAHAARAVLHLGALEDSTADLAKETLEALGLEADDELLMEFIEMASTKRNLTTDVQMLVAKAMAGVLAELDNAAMTSTALDSLTGRFFEDADSRITVARCLERMFAGGMQSEQLVVKAFRFLLRQGLGLTNGNTPEAIELRDILLAAGMSLIEKHGEEFADVLFGAVEEFEDSGAGAASGESAKLGVAVFLGALSKHLGPEHAKVPEILPRLLQRLLDTTSTASVQDAIVKVMPPLMKQDKEKAVETLKQLMETALAPKTHIVTRRGAAMGLGATVKGLSIQAVSQHNILAEIQEAYGNKKEHAVRQGALLCLEGLTLNLGRLFDPYVVNSLPLLLQAFADPNRDVQNASQSAAKAMMSQLSGPGVKQVLKPLLEGIKDKQWRTKLGSVEILATMTNCLPKQLAACLPQVVPALCGVINDQHAKVKDAARDALDRVGSIITSPELKALAPDLISALTDGAQYEHITKEVLDKLLSTSFVHHIDAPSLSLVCPLVQRALKERSAEFKRKGAQIVGSMVLLIKDPKDIQPYLPLLLPQLKVTLVDPVPDVRATVAKAFGTLANGLPEDMLGDVLPWLFEMLRSPESAVERSGAAHGLSEVLMAMGTERIQLLLPDILNNASNRDNPSEVKEGYLGLFVYLPVAMGQAFQPYLEEVLGTLLQAQADDVTSVRDIAFRAGQVLTKQFGASQTSVLLSPLEDGVFDADWRIRHASVQLMGQLIEQILRAHRIPTQSAELMQCDVLPKEWRTHMLASLYIVRSDENVTVKHACAQVWKAVVQNTPRTLKELLPALMTRLIASLASTNREKQRVAARCVGDLVSKLGERVMPELMPIFMNNLSEGDAHVREGVCIGLAELINATTKDLLAQYLDELIPAIRQAIIDDVDTVRSSASLVVALLHNAVGPRATADVVTWVLAEMQEIEEEDHGLLFLNGLEQLMAKQPGAVLPIVLNHLTVEPEDGYAPFQVRGLASIAVVPDGHTIHRHLSDVLPPLIKIASGEDDDLREVAIESAGRVMDVVEQNGLHLLFNELVGAVKDTENARRRAAGAKLFEHFFEHTSLDFVSVLPTVLPAILPVALADEDPDALGMGMRTLNCIVKKCKKEELAPYMGDVRSAVLSLITDPATNAVDPNKLLPGLCEHNGLEPLYPIYQQGLMFGSADARELAAKGLGELVDHTTEAALKPYVVKITGPLIRIVGDRFPGTVKKAIVDTLKSLLLRGGATLKPFLPQLQTAYVKCLADPTEAVRQKAAESLGILVRLSARTEPLINELAGNVASHADPAVRVAMATALGEVLLNVPAAVSETVQEKLNDALVPRVFGGEGDGSKEEREAAAWPFAMVLRRHLDAALAEDLLKEYVEPRLQEAGGAFVLAGACWCQPEKLPPPPEGLCAALQKMALASLPKVLADGDGEVQTAAVVLAAGAASLHAAAKLPWGKMASVEDSLAALVAPGTPVPAPTALSAARHFATAAKAAGATPSGKLAAAVAARGTDKSCQVPEHAERAMAAALGCTAGEGEAEVKAALEKVAGGLDAKAAKELRDYASKRLAAIARHSAVSDFAWDF